MDIFFEKILKYKNYIIVFIAILILFILMLTDFTSRKTSNKQDREIERRERISKKILKAITSENSLIQGIAFIKHLDKAEKNELQIKQIDLHIDPYYEDTKDNNLIARIPELKIPNPAVNTIKDARYGYPVSYSFKFLINNKDSIIRKRLEVRYSLDTIIELDFYTPLVETLINYKLAIKKIEAFDKEQAKHFENLNKEYQAEAKKNEREKKVSEQQIAQKSVPKSATSFTYKSTFYDIEYTNGSVKTVKEETYHKFDLKNRVITQLSHANGEWVSLKYRIRSKYDEGIIMNNNVFVINNMGVKEIWLNLDLPNLGYDYMDGTRIANYGITRVE